MGHIVFKTISENIRSFFGREEELMAQPKAIPEPASEVFEHPGAVPPPEEPKRIVEKPLPDESVQLPFSPDQLRSALKEKPKAPEQPKPEEKDISHEINAFESTLSTIEEPKEIVIKEEPALTLPSFTEGEHSFFDEFAQFALKENLDARGVLEGDVLKKMKEFHQHHKANNEYLAYTAEVKSAIESKIGELKQLEHEWFHTKRQVEESQEGLVRLEDAIKEHTKELKDLVDKAKNRSQLEKSAPPGQEFNLLDGRKLSSLLDLRIALQTMPEAVFRRYVSGNKNDFAAWVAEVLGDRSLALGMRGCKEKYQLSAYLNRLTR